MDWDKLKIFHTVAEAGSFYKGINNLKSKSISYKPTNTVSRERFKNSSF